MRVFGRIGVVGDEVGNFGLRTKQGGGGGKDDSAGLDAGADVFAAHGSA